MIRAATEKDAPRLLEIYAYYVENTVITFEYDVPSQQEFLARMRGLLGKFPYLVVEEEGKILGYAYAGPFHPRQAYARCAEATVYLDHEARKHGLGRQLYTALENALRLQHYLNLNACIGYPEIEDEYLTRNSAEFHAHMGYRMVGMFHHCGYKFGRWYHMVWMEKMLGEHPEQPEPLLSFDAIRPQLKQLYGIE